MCPKTLRRFGARSTTFILCGLAALLSTGVIIEYSWAKDAHYASVTPDQPMKEWLLLGPIPAQKAGEKANAENARKFGYMPDLLDRAGGEAKADPESGRKVDARGGEQKWTAHKSSADIVDLVDALGQHDFAVAYAAATIESPDAKTHLVGLGSDDAIRVWLNGELVHENPEPRAVKADDDIFSIKLKKGVNHLLVKVLNEEGGWAFTFRVLSPETLAERLFEAASEGDTETVEQLLARGVEVDSRSTAGITAAQIAKARGHGQLAEFLVSKGAASPQPFDAKTVLTKLLKEASPDGAPGIAILVAKDGDIVYSHGFGMADLSNDVAITPKTKFRIGSITKQFTAAAILKLQEDGKLNVTDKLSKFLPDFPRGDEVTIRQLLNHTSGIKSYTSKPDLMKTVAVPATTDEMIDSFKNDKFDFDPGTNMMYNNSGYFLLGAIVEKVSGKSYNDYLCDTFFEPLGMHDTGVHTSTAVIKYEATGYDYTGGQPTKALNWDMSRAGAAGALYSTVEDLMRWNEGIFNGKVLSEESLKAAFTPLKLESGQAPMMPYGYGWVIDEYRGVKTISHGGGLQGWSAFLIRYPDQKTTITVLHNSMPEVPSLSPAKITELAADLFLWEQLKPRPKYKVDETVDPATFADYVGRYDYLGAIMDIVLEDKQLTAQLTGQPRYPIFPMGKDKFFWKVADAQIEFVRDDAGNVISARHKQGGINLNVKKIAEETIVKVEDAELNHYVGKYDYPGIGVLTVRKDKEKLFAQMTGQPEFEIFSKGNHKFFWKAVAAEIEFVPNKDGKVEKAIHKQSGATIEVKKTE